ncbi:hypothetical protein KC19_2G075200 [Ceratodon purpureus]|uniref:Uncharacterized protein n=1 Tax=Ceratodon purpureus TaxID=3225 RepID=A0A8T0ITW8_CERPU|nr:hypothetical protein KC19_2G075200 [Ceratodon purpureus]
MFEILRDLGIHIPSLRSGSVESGEVCLQKFKEESSSLHFSLEDLKLPFEAFGVRESFAQGKGSLSTAQKEVKVR